MNLSEQVDAAIVALKELFKDVAPLSLPPPDATVESLWLELQHLKKPKRVKRPGVEESVRLILENPDLSEIPVDTIAEIVREVFAAYGIKCRCSESSVRWYQSQRNLEWTIVKRK